MHRISLLHMVLTTAVLFSAGCQQGENNETVQDSATLMPDSGMMEMSSGSMAAKDGNHEFLRMMSNHHEGLVQMATAAMDKAQVQTTREDAHKLHEKQAMERDSMVSTMQRDYQEHHQAMPMPKNAAQTDSLAALTGKDYDRTFYRLVIAHHREGIGMIDQHMAHLTKREVRQMAEKMKADMQKEIAEFEKKMQAL